MKYLNDINLTVLMELNSSWGGLPVTDDIFNVTSPSTEAKLLSDPD